MRKEYIKTIMSKLNVDQETAENIFDNMEIDFSECTMHEFLQEARMQLEVINMTKGKSFEEIQALLKQVWFGK